MKITIVGAGYVGLVTGACFAEMGNQVACVDVDETRLSLLRGGSVPIHEPGLEALIRGNSESGRMVFTSDYAGALEGSEVVMIAVGTPPQEDGSADLSHVLAVARSIGRILEHEITVVTKSTMPVGTADKVRVAIDEVLAERGEQVPFRVVSNPEFLKEGDAVGDFMSPDRIVVGADPDDASSRTRMRQLYAPFSRNHDKLQFMGIRDAEMTKYAANAMLATKISFMNEIAAMCDHLGVDVESVRKGIGSDPRIGFSFIYPGVGYGGSCFPKDVRALIAMADNVGIDAGIIRAVDSRNQVQKTVLVQKLKAEFGDNLDGKTFAIWGLSFKPDTDDVREAPALEIIRELVTCGGRVVAYDPKAAANVRDSLDPEWTNDGRVSFVERSYDALTGADALLVLTEWKEFRQPDFTRVASALGTGIVFDGRNLYDIDMLARYGLRYAGIGRGSLVV